MITNQILKDLPPDLREITSTILSQLTTTEVILIAIHEAELQLVGGVNSDEKPDDLTKRIIEHRIVAKAMLGIHNLGKQINQEMNRAE